MEDSDAKKYEVILSEEDAFEKALNMAKRGDTVIVFFEDMKPLVSIINKFSSYKEERNIYNIEALN